MLELYDLSDALNKVERRVDNDHLSGLGVRPVWSTVFSIFLKLQKVQNQVQWIDVGQPDYSLCFLTSSWWGLE